MPLPASPNMTPTLCCDLCQWPMALPDHLEGQTVIHGLLVCTQCIEDNLDAQALNTGPHLELVGGRR